MRSFVLGVSAFYHDSAICIIRDDKIIIALQEERFSRRKHDSSFPIQSIKTALIYSKIKPTEITKICFYWIKMKFYYKLV